MCIVYVVFCLCSPYLLKLCGWPPAMHPSPQDLVFVDFGTIMSYQYLRDANVMSRLM